MTLTTTIDRRTVMGNMKIVLGHCTSDSTGGDVVTGLRRVESFIIQEQGTGIATGRAVVNETLPLASGDVKVVTDSGDEFTWIAIGR